jgi:hypothetical protein
MRRVILTTVTLAAVAIACYILIIPWPARVCIWNAKALAEVAGDILENPPDGDLGDSRLPLQLSGTAVRRVHVEGKCAVFSLATWPFEPSVEIFYSPNGYRELPINGVHGPYNRLLELRQIGYSGKWFYMVRN